MKHLQYLLTTIILLVIFYVWCCLRPKSEYTLLQTTIENFTPSLLNEKLPILIESPIVNVSDLLTTVFKYCYIYTKKVIKTENKNKYGYLLITSKTNDISHISIKHPKYLEILNITLHKNQVLVLPPLWWYKCNTEESIDMYGLKTLTTIFLF